MASLGRSKNTLTWLSNIINKQKNNQQCFPTSTVCMNNTPILVVIAKKQLAQQTTKIINNTTINKQTTNANFYRLKVFIGLKLREFSMGNFHRKAPKWAKNQVKVSKIDQISPPLHPTYCGNPPILSSELLWESTFYKFGHQPTVGIHQFCPPSYCGNPLESICTTSCR